MEPSVLFITGCYPKDSDYFVTHSKVMPQNAANVLSWRLIDGFDATIPGRLTVLTCPFIGYFPGSFRKLRIRSRQWSHREGAVDTLLGFINIKGLETYIKSVRIYRFFKRWYAASPANRHVLIYSHYAGFLRAAGKIKRRFPDARLTCLVTDMNECDDRPDLRGLKGKIKGLPRKIMIDTTYKNLPCIDSFVLLAEGMKDPLRVGDRPYVVVEGIADPRLLHETADAGENTAVPPKEEGEFRVVYTGTLHRRYGSVLLAQAVAGMADPSVRLYVCGDGDGREDVQQIAQNASSVNYLGVLRHEDAIALQKSADLLVNSMPEFGIHTALSFPSKTMEYMMVGKPVACFRVKGIPPEYDAYLRYFPEATPKAMAATIQSIRDMTPEQRAEIGRRNQAFVLEKKTPPVQVAAILRMMLSQET